MPCLKFRFQNVCVIFKGLFTYGNQARGDSSLPGHLVPPFSSLTTLASPHNFVRPPKVRNKTLGGRFRAPLVLNQHPRVYLRHWGFWQSATGLNSCQQTVDSPPWRELLPFARSSRKPRWTHLLAGFLISSTSIEHVWPGMSFNASTFEFETLLGSILLVASVDLHS